MQIYYNYIKVVPDRVYNNKNCDGRDKRQFEIKIWKINIHTIFNTYFYAFQLFLTI